MKQTETNQSKRKRYWRWGGAVAVTLLVLLWLAVQNLNPWADKKLKEMVSSKSKGVYTLETAGLHLSLLAGSATLDSLKLIPNDSVWRHVQKQNPAHAPTSLSEIKTAKVQVRGISYLKLLLGDGFSLGGIQVDSPRWTLQQMKKDTTSQPLHQTIGEQMRQVALKELNINNGTFQLILSKDRKNPALSLSGVNLTAKDIQLDSASFQDATRAFYSKNFTVSATAATYALPDGNYKLRSGPLKVSSADKEFSVAKLRLVPLRSAAEMSRRMGEAATRLVIQVPELRMRQVNFPNLSRNANVYIGEVMALNPRVKAYKDGKNFSPKGEGYLPHDLVQKIPFGMNIRKVQVKGLAVRYDELSKEAYKTGYVTGSNINLTLTNFTNDKNLISRKKPAILKASGLLMGKAPMQATVRMALLDPNGYHSMEGTIGKGYPAILNPMVEPSMFISVKSGLLQKGSFQVVMTRASAKGSMKLQYDDFKIAMLSKDPDKRQSLGDKLKSVVANKLVLKSESEANGKAPRAGTIEVQRRPDRSFLTYWKDCLANGTLSVIGAPM